MISARDFLIRALLAGLVAGFLTFGVAYAVGEPSIGTAISLEDAAAHAHPMAMSGTEVPRDLQSTLGLLTGTTLIGTVLGALAGIVTALVLGRLGRASTRATALRVAATGFVVLYAVPFLIYPPNPPGVGSPDTLAHRTTLYFGMVSVSVAAAVVAALAAHALHNRIGAWYAALVSIGGYGLAMVVALALMPRYNEVSATFPAQLLFEFRICSLITQLALWTTIGLVLAELVHRLVSPSKSAAAIQGQRPLPA